MELEVRRATREDLAEVIDILSEAARWLTQRGIKQWPDPVPPEMAVDGMDVGNVYLAYLDGQAAATITLQWSDPFFWGEREPDAGYVHRLAVRRAFGGRGIGERLITWARAETQARGRRYLRLDCMADNAPIRRYYERLGFQHRGDLETERWRASLYEREV